MTDIDLSPEGVLYAWTFLYVPRMGSISFGDTGGYGVGQIDLREGVRIQAPLLGTHRRLADRITDGSDDVPGRPRRRRQ